MRDTLLGPVLADTGSAQSAPPKNLLDTQEVLSVRHWNDRLFSFRTTRPATLRFRPGEFLMIGLPGEDGRPIMRAYSIASPNWADHLEFYSIKVPDGRLTSRLQNIRSGDHINIRPKPVGTLVADALLPGKRLFLFATGTGIAPFASILRDPEVYDTFDEIVLTHTTRTVSALDYTGSVLNELSSDPLLQEITQGKVRCYLSTTREPSPVTGRITDKIATGQLFKDLGIAELSAETDRAMICGSMALNSDLGGLLQARGFVEGANSEPGSFVVEKAFVG